MHTRSTRVVAAAFGLICMTVSATARGAGQVTVEIDCSKGDSIMKALERRAEQLTILITGMCEETVMIERSHVTLRGSDPATDGIRRRGELEQTTVFVKGGVSNTVIENLTITGAETFGLAVDYVYGIELINCSLSGNGYGGAVFGSGSAGVRIINTEFSSNGINGFTAGGGSHVSCTNCTVDFDSTEPVTTAVRVENGSQVTLAGGTLAGRNGILAMSSGLVFASGAAIVGTPNESQQAFALNLREGAGLKAVNNSTLTGPITLDSTSWVDLENVVQSAPAADYAFTNMATLNSSLRLRNGTVIDGNLTIGSFSTCALQGTAGITGNLACNSGGDAHCSDPLAVLGTASCPQCSTSP